MLLDRLMPDAANVIQLAVTPVFLLAGTAGCLNVFATRLARVGDRVGQLFSILSIEENLDAARVRRLTELRRRVVALELAVILCTASGVFTCLATLGLFIGAIREDFREQVLLLFFGSAVVALIGAFGAFLYEMVTACRSMLKQIPQDRAIRRRYRASRTMERDRERERQRERQEDAGD